MPNPAGTGGPGNGDAEGGPLGVAPLPGAAGATPRAHDGGDIHRKRSEGGAAGC